MDLRSCLKKLEEAELLNRVHDELSPFFEISAAIKYIGESRKKAVLFEKVRGYDVPVVGNLYGSPRQLAIAFGVGDDRLDEIYLSRAQSPIKPRFVGNSPAQEVVIDKEVNIVETIPVLTHNEKDAGPYMTSCVTIAKDPETGQRGMGLHRIQIKDKNRIGIYLATPPLSHFFAKAERLNKPLDIAIVSGVEPAVFFAAIYVLERTSATRMDKFEIAGGFAQEAIKLVKCLSSDLEVPANAEFILEGQILPNRREKEGPFGESTGYYLTYNNPVANIRLISHRKDPIYHALAPFSQEVESLIGVMMLPSLLRQIKIDLPEVRVIRLSFMALGEICVAQIYKKTEEDPITLIKYLFDNPFIKIVIVADNDVNISDPYEVAWAVSTRVRFGEDIFIQKDLPGLMIDPSVGDLERVPDTSLQVGRTAKIGIDATKPLHELEKFEKVDVPSKVKEKILRLLGTREN